jgi:hypothetical protein
MIGDKENSKQESDTCLISDPNLKVWRQRRFYPNQVIRVDPELFTNDL